MPSTTSHQRLLRAAELVLAGLDARIKAAPANAVPVFDGIVDLHDAIVGSRQHLAKAGR